MKASPPGADRQRHPKLNVPPFPSSPGKSFPAFPHPQADHGVSASTEREGAAAEHGAKAAHTPSAEGRQRRKQAAAPLTSDTHPQQLPSAGTPAQGRGLEEEPAFPQVICL